MASDSAYVVITPVRNEENNLPHTVESFVAQTIQPAIWIIVDDGSTDKTDSIADAAAARYPWIRVVHRKDRGFRQPGTGVVEAFYDGLASLGETTWDYLIKFDGDLAFAPDYFQRCFEKFDENERLGIGGGLICRREAENLVVESNGDPAFHVRGATKIYRRSCWEQIGGLMKAPGWDTIDELKANMLGWETRTFEELKVHQLKDTGSADGNWRNWVKNGLANYITGYHPLFMLVKCLKRVFARPYGIGAGALAWGFLSGYVRGTRRVDDPELIRYVQKQQFRKLTLRSSLWG
jgi:glycosyltransferase involved in cell wall biosynthesis